MESNVGDMDRTARLAGGAAVALLGVLTLLNVLSLGSTAGVVMVVIGAIVFGTGLTRQCPAYRLVGINTCKRT